MSILRYFRASKPDRQYSATYSSRSALFPTLPTVVYCQNRNLAPPSIELTMHHTHTHHQHQSSHPSPKRVIQGQGKRSAQPTPKNSAGKTEKPHREKKEKTRTCSHSPIDTHLCRICQPMPLQQQVHTAPGFSCVLVPNTASCVLRVLAC
jgi:hypothetical protein